jgi:hypothetical protein
MKRRSFLKGLLAAPFVAKAVLSEKEEDWVKEEVDYTPEISGLLRQQEINDLDCGILLGKGAIANAGISRLNFDKGVSYDNDYGRGEGMVRFQTNPRKKSNRRVPARALLPAGRHTRPLLPSQPHRGFNHWRGQDSQDYAFEGLLGPRESIW